MAREQGAVVIGTDPFGDRPRRPYLIVSNASHPFQGEEYLAAVVTTTERDRAIPLAGRYAEGGLPERSFVSPWSLVTLKDGRIDKRVASVTGRVLVDVAAAVAGYLDPESESTSGAPRS